MANYRQLASATRGARGRGRWLLLVAGLAATVACGQEEPTEPVEVIEQGYFPLVPGAWWDYAHSDWDERVTVEAADFNGAPAFLVSDSPNPDDGLRSDSILTLVNGRAARMTKEEYFIGTDGSETL